MVRYLSWPAVSWNRGGKNAINYDLRRKNKLISLNFWINNGLILWHNQKTSRIHLGSFHRSLWLFQIKWKFNYIQKRPLQEDGVCRGRKPLFKEIPNRLNRFHSPKMQQLFDGTVCIFNTFQILCTYHVPFAVVVALKALHLID